jgi:hypothetical protein
VALFKWEKENLCREDPAPLLEAAQQRPKAFKGIVRPAAPMRIMSIRRLCLRQSYRPVRQPEEEPQDLLLDVKAIAFPSFFRSAYGPETAMED